MVSVNHYSENWYEATEKFIKAASKFGDVKWVQHPGGEFNIPYVKIGNGPNVIVINSGVHGLEGYFGSAAQLLFLNEFAIRFKNTREYSFVLIHVINGWGMQNRMREVMSPGGGLVDLNRNFGVDFSNPAALPRNEKYKFAHDILVSQPHVKRGHPTKLQQLLRFRKENLAGGVWASIARGQYYEPYGLFYGGGMQMPENKMTLEIYDTVTRTAKSLISVGLHTGLGHFDRAGKAATCDLLVSHPSSHPNTRKFMNICDGAINVTADEGTANGPTLLGDLVDCLEARYKNIPVYTADLEVGTGEWPVLSQVLKRMDMGDARYDLLNNGRISKKTMQNLTESWYPSDIGWRDSALNSAHKFFNQLIGYSEKNKE